MPSNGNRGEGGQATNGSGVNQSNQVHIQLAANTGVGNESNQRNGGQAGINSGGFNREALIEGYEKGLKDALWWACTIGSLHALCRFLAYCNLSSATVVLLGAFAPYLVTLDFAFVVCLLLLEGGRLASASFFMCLLMRPLAYRSQDPKKINHGEDGHYPRSRRARVSSFMVQFTLIVPSMVLPAIGHHFLHYNSPEKGPTKLVGNSPNDRSTTNLQTSLRIFYSFVAFNSVVALVNLMLSARAFASLNKCPEQSILRYFDTVLQNGTSSGLVRADDFEFFCFAYRMLGSEYRRNVQPEAVAKNHKQLIQYMYAHRLGMDFLQINMNSEDAFVQLAAVNMVGFWADATWGVGLGSEVKLPRQVLTRLADKVGLGQVGWAANTCIGVLACKPEWTETLAHIHTSSGLLLLDCLVETVDDSSSRSLSTVRTLARLYEQLCVNKEGPPVGVFKAETNLATKLRNLRQGAKVHRLRVQAAYLLLMMYSRPKECSERERERRVIVEINPTNDTYWFQSEVRMLESLLSAVGAPNFPLPHDFVIREDSKITPPLYISAT